jgi:hypothetical protein
MIMAAKLSPGLIATHQRQHFSDGLLHANAHGAANNAVPNVQFD